VRFVLDHDVDARIVGLLVRQGHECWTVANANLYDAADDTITVYADERQAVVVTHDREFSRRRRRNPVGMHLQLRCLEPDAAELLEKHLDHVLSLLKGAQHIFIQLSAEGCTASYKWDDSWH
jgi:predicted nuclease of predicted toxin-antitoxin system